MAPQTRPLPSSRSAVALGPFGLFQMPQTIQMGRSSVLRNKRSKSFRGEAEQGRKEWASDAALRTGAVLLSLFKLRLGEKRFSRSFVSRARVPLRSRSACETWNLPKVPEAVQLGGEGNLTSV